MSIRFFYNGIKVNNGPLIKGHWSIIEAWNNYGREVETHIVMYQRGYSEMPKEVYEAFRVENNSDSQTDYFETSRIRVPVAHPLFPQAAAALAKDIERSIARCEKHGDIDSAARYRRDMVKLAGIVAGGSTEAVADATGVA